MTNRDEAMRDSLAHNSRVGDLMIKCIGELSRRSIGHDESKFDEEEWDIFVEYVAQLRETTFDSDEYRIIMDKIKPSVEYHYKMNPHHPEHYENGINGMTLMDLIEMLCDWMAATERQKGGDIRRSFEINQKRFNISPQLKLILENTTRHFGWM